MVWILWEFKNVKTKKSKTKQRTQFQLTFGEHSRANNQSFLLAVADVEEQVRGDDEVNIQNEHSLMKEVLEWS